MAGPILLVHDDIATIAAVRRLVAREGREVVLATSVADAVIAYGHHLPSLVILAPAVEGGRGGVVVEELALNAEAASVRLLFLGERIEGVDARTVELPLDGAVFLERFRAALNDPPGIPWTQPAAPAAASNPGLEEALFGDLPLQQASWELAAMTPEEREAHALRLEREQAAQANIDAAFEQTHAEIEAEAMASLESAWRKPGEAVDDEHEAPMAPPAGVDDEELRLLEEDVRAEAARRRELRTQLAPKPVPAAVNAAAPVTAPVDPELDFSGVDAPSSYEGGLAPDEREALLEVRRAQEAAAAAVEPNLAEGGPPVESGAAPSVDPVGHDAVEAGGFATASAFDFGRAESSATSPQYAPGAAGYDVGSEGASFEPGAASEWPAIEYGAASTAAESSAPDGQFEDAGPGASDHAGAAQPWGEPNPGAHEGVEGADRQAEVGWFGNEEGATWAEAEPLPAQDLAPADHGAAGVEEDLVAAERHFEAKGAGTEDLLAVKRHSDAEGAGAEDPLAAEQLADAELAAAEEIAAAERRADGERAAAEELAAAERRAEAELAAAEEIAAAEQRAEAERAAAEEIAAAEQRAEAERAAAEEIAVAEQRAEAEGAATEEIAAAEQRAEAERAATEEIAEAEQRAEAERAAAEELAEAELRAEAERAAAEELAAAEQRAEAERAAAEELAAAEPDGAERAAAAEGSAAEHQSEIDPDFVEEPADAELAAAEDVLETDDVAAAATLDADADALDPASNDANALETFAPSHEAEDGSAVEPKARRRGRRPGRAAGSHDPARLATEAARRALQLVDRARTDPGAITVSEDPEADAEAERIRSELEAAASRAERERETREQLERELEAVRSAEHRTRRDAQAKLSHERDLAERSHRDAEERLVRELESSRQAEERARQQAAEALRLVQQERARREEEERQRQEAEAEAQRAREDAKALSLPPLAGLLRHVSRSGTVSLGELASLVLKLQHAPEALRLELRSDDAVRTLYFDAGAIIAATSNVSAESLLSRARRDGLIDAAQESELRMVRAPGANELLRLMQGRGYLREPEVIPLVQRQVEQIALEALSEARSDYRLLEAAPTPELLRVTPSRPPVQLLCEAVKRGVEAVPVDELGTSLHAIPSWLDAHVDLGAYAFSDRERRVLRAIDGQSSVGALLLRAGAQQDPGIRTLEAARLLSLLAVRMPPPSAESSLPDLELRRLDAKFEEVQAADYFSVLGLSRAAGGDEVSRAFELLSTEFHPLRFAAHPDPSIQLRAQQVHDFLVEAAQALGDDLLRAQYARNLAD